jgi:ATP-dependent helicase HrpA
MWRGTRRLLLLTIPSPARWVTGRLDNAAQLALAGAPHGSLAAVLEDAGAAAADALMAQAGGPAWDAAGFARLRDHVAGELAETTAAIVAQVVAVLDEARALRARFETLTAAPFHPARDDVAAQLGRLVYPGFVADAGAQRLPDVLRYLRGAARRLDRLPDTLPGDRDRMRAVRELEAEYEARVAAWPTGLPQPDGLREARWLLQELRVSQFAQGVGVRGQVSAKRIRKSLDVA